METARLDERGRLQLPADLRQRLDLHGGDELVVFDERDGVLVLASRKVAARSLIGLVGRGDRSAVDDLAALRREDAEREESEASRYDDR
jgi:AbrB family looped-hinge helix DNA binding protein